MTGRIFVLLLAVDLSGCTPQRGQPQDQGQPAGVAASLTITPADAVLTLNNQGPATQRYTAIVRSRDGTTRDVSGETAWRAEDPALGEFSGSTFRASDKGVAATLVHGAWQGLDVAVKLTVRMEKDRVVAPATSHAPQLFTGAAEDGALAPVILYPSHKTVLPPNLGELEVHWLDTSGNDLFEVMVSSPLVDVRLFVPGMAYASSWIALAADEWVALSGATRGATLSVTVRGLNQAAPDSAGTAAPHLLRLAAQDVSGGIYYWTPSNPAGIYRHDFSRPADPPERYYTAAEAPNGWCVGCHALSPDGKHFAFTYQSAECNSDCGDVLSAASRMPLWAPGTARKWVLPTFEPPDGQRLVTTSPEDGSGVLTLRQTATGMLIQTVPAPGYATEPAFSPLGRSLAYVVADNPMGSNEAHTSAGRIVVQDFDPVTAAFGATRDVVTPADGGNAYYPSWSPDGKWLLFDQSTATNYNEPSAQLYAVPADGSLPPILLAAANVASGLTNSWPRFAPFAGQDAEGRSLYWFTFSSRRPFGARSIGGAQLWMAAFFPDAAAAGKDPSAPAFWLPFQDINTSNHSAQWTQAVVEIE